MVLNMLSSIQREHPEALARPLKVDMAYPSHHIAGLDKEYLGLIESEDNLRLPESGPGRSNALFVSSMTCMPICDASDFAPPY